MSFDSNEYVRSFEDQAKDMNNAELIHQLGKKDLDTRQELVLVKESLRRLLQFADRLNSVLRTD